MKRALIFQNEHLKYEVLVYVLHKMQNSVVLCWFIAHVHCHFTLIKPFVSEHSPVPSSSWLHFFVYLIPQRKNLFLHLKDRVIS